MSEDNTTVTNVNQDEKVDFSDISADHTTSEVVEDSLCMHCHYPHGTTRILLTKVPFFKEIMIFAFHCPECGFKSNEIRSAGSIEPKGVHIELQVMNQRDLNRQIVKMESATVMIPVLDFEIPPSANGNLNTVEGLIRDSMQNITHFAETNGEEKEKLFAFVAKLDSLLELKEPFTLVVDDPSGNSFVENPSAPKQDAQLNITHFVRSGEQDVALGLAPGAGQKKDLEIPQDIEEQEVLSLPNQCSYCGADGVCKMVLTDIPYFKNVVLMAFTCDECGYKTNEVKPGGAISDKGKRLTLRVETIEDLSRDVLKSDTANAFIPEIDVEVTHGSLGGKFTTVEGLIQVIKTELEKNPFFRGDSADKETSDKYQYISEKLEKYMNNEEPFTLVIDDPIANSYIQSLYAPDPDPNLDEVEYERTFEQNEELGLNDIKTENYENDIENEKKQAEQEEEEESSKDK
ncbi:hypothetical protein CYY_008850 [Polysphondylium violaceum]|uniref:Zinc finger ZPR1-type domain-containing protein n=1 Tax=Polysphondylium violaceum TaxID=133409 RepID=A0A8J4PMH1_9MYCE|nr:hypothetical protein CYY_008850 [Polysphondylium violaceum]